MGIKFSHNTLASRYSSCLDSNQAKILTIGAVSGAAFNTGRQAAESQITAHPEVSLGNYSLVINKLLSYIRNLMRNDDVIVPSN